jgi:post-segregation antitoxin (ccd killing protein)
MTRQRRKTESLAARVPADLKADLAEVARARGMDLSALVNSILAEARPGLLRWLRQHQAELSETNGHSVEGV